MSFRILYLFVEGPDDEMFVDHILKPLMMSVGILVETYCYSGKTQLKLNNFIQSIVNMNADYIFLSDMDGPCVSSCKQKAIRKYKRLDPKKIQVVSKEIESWYLAGLQATSDTEFKELYNERTDDVTKEKFNNLIPQRFKASRLDFMLEIIRQYDYNNAMARNSSFRYFMTKHISEGAIQAAMTREND